MFRFLTTASVLGAAASTQCSLTCDTNSTCYATMDATLDCLTSIPFNKDWATATVDVLAQSLENYGFLQLYHNTGPPYVTAPLDIEKELLNTQTMINQGAFTTDIDFQEHVQDLIQITQDAHTRYQKPVCYNAVFLQPFAIDVRIVESEQPADSVSEEPRAFLMRNKYTDQYLEMYPNSPIESFIGQELTLLDNLEFTTAIVNWADSHETRSNNRGVRFNQAVRSYFYRSAIQYNVRPLSDLSLTMVDGQTYNFPWIASYTTGLADVEYCAAVDPREDLEARRLKFPDVNRTQHPQLFDPIPPLSTEALRKSSSERVVIVPSDAPNAVSCFLQKVDGEEGAAAGISTSLVMKVSSFAPASINGFLTDVEACITSDYDMMVIDVMQNGGGQVCLGLRLLELLIEDYYNDHSLVQMNYDLTHSKLMDQYIEVVNSNSGYIDKSTGEPYPDGKAYYYGRTVTQGGVTHERTNFFSLDCSSMEKLPVRFKPARFLTPDKLVFLTDGTCGSTCACFTKIAKEHDKATLVGAGGLWEESMDVSSFAGGFVSNPDNMATIARQSGIYNFPKFLTNQNWQFDWAIWYSNKFPTRPAQFVVTEPDFRESFWGFPHSSIDADVTTAMVSSLYDRVIYSTVARLAHEAE
jgi:hypothetical protein